MIATERTECSDQQIQPRSGECAPTAAGSSWWPGCRPSAGSDSCRCRVTGGGFRARCSTRSRTSGWSPTSTPPDRASLTRGPRSEPDAVNGHAPGTAWLLAQHCEKVSLVLDTPLLVQQQRHRPPREGEIAATVDLNGYQLLLECSDPSAFPDRSETFD